MTKDNTMIEVLRLTTATFNLLKRNHVNTIQELEALTVRDLSDMKIGAKRYDEIRKAIGRLAACQ